MMWALEKFLWTVTKWLKSWDGVISLLYGSAGIWCKYLFYLLACTDVME